MDFLRLGPGKRIYYENGLPKISANCTEDLARELIDQQRVKWDSDQRAFADGWVAARDKIRQLDEEQRLAEEKGKSLNSRTEKWFYNLVHAMGKEGKTLKDSSIEPLFRKMKNALRRIDDEVR